MQAVLYTLLTLFVIAGACWAPLYPPDLSPRSLEREYAGCARSRDALWALIRAGGVLETESLLPRIRAPTLLHPCARLASVGAEDSVLPRSNAQQFAHDIDNVEVVVIPGAGHAPMLEQPRRGWRSCSTFSVSAKAAGRRIFCSSVSIVR